MGHLHPPSQNCYALVRMEFLHDIYKILILIPFIVKNVQLHPQDKFLATPLCRCKVYTHRVSVSFNLSSEGKSSSIC